MKNVAPLVIILSLACSCVNRSEKGEAIAKKYCSTCHTYPDPQLLDKKSWRDGVLPEMAFRMGVDFSKLYTLNETDLSEILESLPESPLVSDEEWKMIEDYYITHAPDSLLREADQSLSALRQFKVTTTVLPIGGKNLLTLLKHDDHTNTLFAGTRLGKLFMLDRSLNVRDSMDVGSPPSALLNQPEGLMISTMGIMDPNDQRKGKVIFVDGGKPVTIVDSLKRPVWLEKADLNQDGADDLLVSAFGDFTGELVAFEKTGMSYRRHIIHKFPGTRKTIVRDVNNDGLPDILALITQGDEHIALFTNRGKFRFAYRVLLRFPPAYGSSYFELADFNNDGKFDILYTNGDNADYSPILKSYHGVRIFLNDGLNDFSQSWFYAMNGATMARAADYDEDGDLDIAAIAFFPDFEHPEHSFIYFENQQATYRPYYTKPAAAARWITMEVADVDSDQDLDIVLASLNFTPGVPDTLVRHWRSDPASLLLLENILK